MGGALHYHGRCKARCGARISFACRLPGLTMPYYIYRISNFPIRQLQMLEQQAAFSAASARAKLLRAEGAAGAEGAIKVIFADSELHAEDLLSQVRAAQPNPADD